MIKVIFKNLSKSSLAKKIIQDKIRAIVDKFPDLRSHSIHVTLSRNNSAIQAGPDEYLVRLHISGRKFKNLILEKKADTVYHAFAFLKNSALELLNRNTDKMRVQKIAKLRKAKYQSRHEPFKEAG